MKKKTATANFSINPDECAPFCEPITFDNNSNDGSVWTVDPSPKAKLFIVPRLTISGKYGSVDIDLSESEEEINEKLKPLGVSYIKNDDAK